MWRPGPTAGRSGKSRARPLEAGQPAPALRIALSATDKAGLYRVAVQVRDLHAKRMVRAERIFGLRLE